jgi:beta-glucosidase
MEEIYGDAVPEYTLEDMDTIKIGSEMETLGFNYYLGRIVKYDDSTFNKAKVVRNPKERTNDLDWPIFVPPTYTEGLYDVLSKLYHRYSEFGVNQIYITENGLALETPKDKSGEINDKRRIRYYKEHFAQIHKAIKAGIPVKKFFLWTLMDNYEWAEGYSSNSCFGIVHVDRDTMERTWKQSAHWYKNVVKTNTVDFEGYGK